jgi:hypothetical protein
MIAEAEVATKPQNAQWSAHELPTMTDAIFAGVGDFFVTTTLRLLRLREKLLYHQLHHWWSQDRSSIACHLLYLPLNLRRAKNWVGGVA